MSTFSLRLAAAAAALALAAPLASATVLTFDDLGADGLVPATYGGLDWSGSSWFHFDGEQAPFAAHSGSGRATLGWDGTTASSTIGLGNGATFAGAWFAGFEGVTVAFDLYRQGALVASSTTLGVSGASTFLASGYTGLVDGVRVRTSDGANFVMDDFTFAVAAPVPEPGNVALMLAGIAVVGAVARRRATK